MPPWVWAKSIFILILQNKIEEPAFCFFSYLTLFITGCDVSVFFASVGKYPMLKDDLMQISMKHNHILSAF